MAVLLHRKKRQQHSARVQNLCIHVLSSYPLESSILPLSSLNPTARSRQVTSTFFSFLPTDTFRQGKYVCCCKALTPQLWPYLHIGFLLTPQDWLIENNGDGFAVTQITTERKLFFEPIPFSIVNQCGVSHQQRNTSNIHATTSAHSTQLRSRSAHLLNQGHLQSLMSLLALACTTCTHE